MASIRQKTTEKGKVFYEIRVRIGRDIPEMSTRWYRPEGWSQERVERELNRYAANFEEGCREGIIKHKRVQIQEPYSDKLARTISEEFHERVKNVSEEELNLRTIESLASVSTAFALEREREERFKAGLFIRGRETREYFEWKSKQIAKRSKEEKEKTIKKIDEELLCIEAESRKNKKRNIDCFCVYKHTFPDGKVYIGQTNNTQKRWRDGHGYKGQKKIFDAIIKYGWDNITHEILIDGLSQKLADLAESLYIKKFDTVNNGYNANIGHGDTSYKMFVYGIGEILTDTKHKGEGYERQNDQSAD